MVLKQLIHKRIFEGDFSLFDTSGNLVAPEAFRSRYAQLKAHLAISVPADGRVAIRLPKGPDYLMTMLVCMDLGIPYIPLKDSFPDARVDQISQLSGSPLLITSSSLNQILNSERSDVQSSADRSPFSGTSPLYIMFTSGSTGAPKGVVISRDAAANYCLWLDQYFTGIVDQDRVLQVTDFTFDISLIDVFLFLSKNVSLYFSSFTGNVFSLAFEVEKYGITTLNTVPNNFQMLLEPGVFERANYSSLKCLMVGGARFSNSLYKRLSETMANRQIFNLYGPTECTIYTHVQKIGFNEYDLTDNTISIGKPITGVKSVVWTGERVAKPREKGELLLGGVQLMNEYLNDSEKTQKAFLTIQGEKYYRTGDLAFVDEWNQFYIVGRNDDTIKRRGFRINLSDIDGYITKLPYVIESATIAVEDVVSENRTISYIKLREQRAAQAIKADLAKILPDYQIPEELIFVDKYPVNDNGKICKKSLAQTYTTQNSRKPGSGAAEA